MTPGRIDLPADPEARGNLLAYWRRPENLAEAARLGFVQPELIEGSVLLNAWLDREY